MLVYNYNITTLEYRTVNVFILNVYGMFMFPKGPRSRRRTSARLSANHEPAGAASSASFVGPRDVS